MAVLDPVKLIIDNYPEGKTEELEAENLPAEGSLKRKLPFSRELYIEREDFMEIAPKKWFRLTPGGMVRLKNAFIIRCESFVKDAEGKLEEIHCTYIPESRSGQDSSGITVKGTIHWVSAAHALDAEIRLYERLFNVENPAAEERDFKEFINPDSLEVITNAKVEPSLNDAQLGDAYQFIRKGYFCLDRDSSKDHPVFNRTTTLKDAWGKMN